MASEPLVRGKIEYKWIALSVTTIGALMAAIDGTIVILALPDMMVKLHAGLVEMVWVIMAYILMSTVCLLTFGRIADMFGRVRMYNLGFIIFTVGSALCGFSRSATELIAFRLVQGAGAAFMMVNSPAIIAEVFPPHQRGRALGINGITWAIGGIAGPLLGGLILAAANWRWIFFINVPIGMLGTVWGYLALREKSTRNRAEKFDLAGAAAFSLGLVALLFALTIGIQLSWTSLPILVLFALFLAMLAVFLPARTAGCQSGARSLAVQKPRLQFLRRGGNAAVPRDVCRQFPHRFLFPGCARLQSPHGGPLSHPAFDHERRGGAPERPRGGPHRRPYSRHCPASCSRQRRWSGSS